MGFGIIVISVHTEIKTKGTWNHMAGSKKYSCTHCDKKFKFNTQYQCNLGSGCELPAPEPDRSNSPEF